MPGFNGAALVRVRKGRHQKGETEPALQGFNGAALVRVRKGA